MYMHCKNSHCQLLVSNSHLNVFLEIQIVQKNARSQITTTVLAHTKAPLIYVIRRHMGTDYKDYLVIPIEWLIMLCLKHPPTLWMGTWNLDVQELELKFYWTLTQSHMHNYICRKKLCSNRKKTLGAMFGCEKFHQYVYRRSVILASNQSISH